MTGGPQQELIHKTNNLLAVIYAQTAVGRQALDQGRPEEAAVALERIQSCAEATQEFVRNAADALRRST